MSTAPTVYRDERTAAVEGASYRWAYLALSFGLLAAVAYRAFARGESAWDLLALVVAGGVVTTGYQAAHRVLSSRWAGVNLLVAVVAACLAAGVAWLR